MRFSGQFPTYKNLVEVAVNAMQCKDPSKILNST